ncbi:hypothetical protein V6N13_087818 [Hibiscus sabdariffa]
MNVDRLDWLRIILSRPVYFVRVLEHWDFMFSAVLWRLWLHHNQIVFDSEYSEGRSLVDLCPMARDDMVRGATTSLPHVPQAVINDQAVHWQPPPSDWLKLNCDGPQITQNGSSACGGVLRDATTRCSTKIVMLKRAS